MNYNGQELLLKLFYFIFFTTFASFLPFLPLYLREIGLESGKIGVIMGIGPLVMLLAQPVWGMVSDYLQKRILVLRLTLLASSLATLLFPVTTEFTLIVLITVLYTFFQTPITPLADSIVLTHHEAAGGSFGKVRLWGSLGFALAVVVMGLWLQTTELKNMFTAVASLYLASFLVTLGLREHKKAGRQKLTGQVKDILTNKRFLLFLAYSCLVQLTFAAYNTFFGLLFTSLGGTTYTLGLAWFIAAISEIPVFLYSRTLLLRFGSRKLLVFAGLIFSLRWFFFSLVQSPVQIIFFQVLQSLSFGVFYFSAVNYVNHIVPSQLRSTGQSLFAALGFGLGATLGNFLGGMMVDQVGLSAMFMASGFLCLAAVVGFVATRKVE
ncbi:MAG: major facilitator superfamily domain-containing protein 6 [Clostridia bacterium]|nr:major facilitator superfamily domain-containing protein 6 [Clostridia bacterium]